MRRYALFSSALLILPLLGLTGCGDSAAPDGPGAAPTRGWIEVTTVTSGVEFDPDGYTITIFGEPGLWEQTIGVNGIELFAYLRPVEYFVEITGVAQNCEVSGARLRTLTVAAGDTARTEFTIECYSTAPLQDQIVFSSDRESGDFEIYVMDSDGGGLMNLSRDPAVSDITPDVSHDGTQIAYSTNRDGRFEIYLMRVNGTGKQRQSLNEGTNRNPSWSADDSLLAYESAFVCESIVRAISATTPGFGTQLTFFDCDVASSAPDWSPVDFILIYTSDVMGDRELFSEDVDSGLASLTNLTNDPSADDEPAWSPDGTKIAFTSDRDGDFDIYVMNADGTGVVQLTDDAAEDRAPVWSADGTRIAFETNRDGDFEIYVVNADGTGLVNLTRHPASDRSPSWSP